MLDVLDVRENREKYIQKYFSASDKTLAVVRANYPSKDKANPYTSYVAYTFCDIMEQDGWKRIGTEFEVEGLVYYLCKNISSKVAKKCTINLEDEHPLGRLVDIDVYSKMGQESRKTLRKCFICDEDAVVCVRNKSHTVDEIVDFFKKKVENYIFEKPRQRIAKFAMIGELSRKISLGTVNFLTTGCHDDMTEGDYYRSIKVISPEFEKLSKYPSYKEAKSLGIEIEKIMREKVKVNTHQGLIFHLLVLYVAEKDAKSSKEFVENIKSIGNKSMEDFDKGKAKYSQDYKKYGLSGARGSAKEGYRDIINILPKIEKMSVDELFIHLAKENGDTNILRRGGIDTLRQFQKKVSDIKDEKTLQIAEDYAKLKNISAGGTADLIAVSLACLLIYKKNGWEMLYEN